jgi:hypothetical protein
LRRQAVEAFGERFSGFVERKRQPGRLNPSPGGPALTIR